MVTITLKNVPPEIYERIKIQAKNNHRSINGEILSILEQAISILDGVEPDRASFVQTHVDNPGRRRSWPAAARLRGPHHGRRQQPSQTRQAHDRHPDHPL